MAPSQVATFLKRKKNRKSWQEWPNSKSVQDYICFLSWLMSQNIQQLCVFEEYKPSLQKKEAPAACTAGFAAAAFCYSELAFFSCGIFSTVLAQVVTESISSQHTLLLSYSESYNYMNRGMRHSKILFLIVFSHTCSKWKISTLEPVAPVGEISHEWTSMHAGQAEVRESYNSWQCNHKVNRDTVYI